MSYLKTTRPGNGLRVYLAGKISATQDWRGRILKVETANRLVPATVNGQCAEVMPSDSGQPGEGIDWTPQPFTFQGKQFVYTGPFFLGCDHGCFHGAGSHATINLSYAQGEATSKMLQEVESSRGRVLGLLTGGILAADLLFAWFDPKDPGAYGTAWEVGFALGHNIPIATACPIWHEPEAPDWWIAWETGAESVASIHSADPAEAFRTAVCIYWDQRTNEQACVRGWDIPPGEENPELG